MKYDLTSLNPMDKHFFGKPLSQFAKEKVNLPESTTKFVESSFDDFNKHFDVILNAFKNGSKKLEVVPDADVYTPSVKPATIKESFISF